MSLLPLDVEYSPRQGLAVYLLDRVVPLLLNDAESIDRKIAVARTWYLYLRDRIRENEVPPDYTKWGVKEIEKIAEAIINYVKHILKA